MPRVTHIRGLSVAAIAGQRQAVHAAQVQAAMVPVIVGAEVEVVAGDLSGLAAEVTGEINGLKERVHNLEHREP